MSLAHVHVPSSPSLLPHEYRPAVGLLLALPRLGA